MRSILGISIGTRNVGFAVIHYRMLTDYRIRTFAGKWTQQKCESIWRIVESLIQQYKITDITVKVPPLSHCSGNIEALITGIERKGKRFHVDVHHVDIRDINFRYGGSGKRSAKAMVAALIEKYPELKERACKKGQARAYNAKLFEAIACAELALRAGH